MVRLLLMMTSDPVNSVQIYKLRKQYVPSCGRYNFTEEFSVRNFDQQQSEKKGREIDGMIKKKTVGQ